jgi:peroxiredoxin
MRLALAAVLLVAGIAKVADLPGSRQAMRDFGLPNPLAAPFGVILPLVEIALAVALLPAATAWLGASVALALFLLFTGAITVNLARGRTPNCHCFGQLHSQPIGRATLTRNALLALVAAIVALQGPDGAGPGLLSWIAGISVTGYLVMLGCAIVVTIIAVQSWMLLNLLRQNGRLLLRLESIEKHLGLAAPAVEGISSSRAPRGLPVGSVAPAFQLPALDGSQQSLATLLAPGKPLLLLFSSANCAPCIELMGEVAQWQRKYAQRLTIAVANRGAAEAVRAKAGGLDPASVLLQAAGEVAAAYLVSGTPSAVLISTDGRIRASLAEGATAVRELVASSSQPLAMMAEQLLPRAPIALREYVPSHNPHAATVTTGQPAPEFRLPNLAGKMVELADLRGAPTLLLFWNPTCGFCRRMLGDLQAWEAAHSTLAPRLVLISTGSVEANQAQALAALTLLEDGFATGFAYGAKGTPSAILLDAQGKVASELVVGASNILRLLTASSDSAPALVAQPFAA